MTYEVMLRDMRVLILCFVTALSAFSGWLEHYERGEKMLSEGRSHEAIRELSLALEQRPGQPEVLDALGRSELVSGRYREARRYFERAAKVSTEPVSRANWAQACFALGEYRRAEELMREALNRVPQFAAGWQLLGQIRYKEGRYEEAASDFRKALGLTPNPGIWNDLAMLYQEWHKPRESLNLLREAMQALPAGQGRARIRGNLGVLEWELGTRAEAVVTVGKAVEEMTAAVGEKHPDTSMMLAVYGEMLRKSGRKAEASEVAARAEQIRALFASQVNSKGSSIDWRELRREGR